MKTVMMVVLLVMGALSSRASGVRVLQGELRLGASQGLALRVSTDERFRGTYCLNFAPASLARKPWLVPGLNVEVHARMPSSVAECVLVSQIRPIILDPGGATVRQGPLRALSLKKSK